MNTAKKQGEGARKTFFNERVSTSERSYVRLEKGDERESVVNELVSFTEFHCLPFDGGGGGLSKRGDLWYRARLKHA